MSAVTPSVSSGTGLRTYGVSAALAHHHPVEIAYVPFGDERPAMQFSALENVSLRRVEVSRGPRRVAAYLRARLRGIPGNIARGVSSELIGVVQDVGEDVSVVADGPVVAGALMGAAQRRKMVYLAHNLESSGFRGGRGQAGLARFERRVLRTFSECWMATGADERGARALAGDGVRTRYVPNVVDVERIEPVRPAGRHQLLFIGDFSYPPNREALRWLAAEVLPELWRAKPDVGLLAVGRGLPDSRFDARIQTPGFVADLRSVYAEADVVVVPLLRGGGSPLKFIEALAYGLPVVATAHAAALLEQGEPGRDFLAAGTAPAFARAIEELLGDSALAAGVGEAGRTLVSRCYSLQALTALLAR